MKILICGDSFCVTDPKFPKLHWSEKLLELSSDIEVYNLSMGGASNALITMQLMQGLKLKPDFIILSFTNEHRYEKDNNINAMPYDLSAESISAYIKERYSPNQPNMTLSTNFEKIKNYFYIIFCLQILKEKQINFCFSLGGFEYQQDYTALLKLNFLNNDIPNYSQCELTTNLWYHKSTHAKAPFFHVDKEEVHVLFANECFSHLNNTHA